jgi:hypothetical protein
MADASPTHIGENSREYVAYKLFLHFVHADKKSLGVGSAPGNVAPKYILDTYAECLEAVRGQRVIQPD